MAVTLQQLLAAPDIVAVRAKLLGKLQAKGLPTTSWASGDPERTMMEMDADAIFDLVASLIPLIAGGGFVDYAITDWLTLLAKQRYNLDRNLAIHTRGTIRLTNVATSPYTVQPDTLWFLFPAGTRYNGPKSVGAVTVPASGFIDVIVQSESPNHSIATGPSDSAPLVNYIDDSGLIITTITPLAGVTATNPAPVFSGVVLDGAGTGTITPSSTPSGQFQVTIRIDVSGQAGIASWSYSINGTAHVSAGAVSSASNIGGSGITVTLANGATNPSFLSGETYTFSAPGTWIGQQGTDQESDRTLAARCRNRWPSLSALVQSAPTLGYYDLLARQASSQVTQTRVQTDSVINNKVYIVIAGQGGILPNAVVTSVQDYVSKRVPLTDFPVVLSPVKRPILLTGIVTCDRAKVAAAQATSQAALATYVNTLVQINGTVRLAEIVDVLMSTDGIVDVTGLTVNGAAANLALPSAPGAYELANWAQTIASSLTWVSV